MDLHTLANAHVVCVRTSRKSDWVAVSIHTTYGEAHRFAGKSGGHYHEVCILSPDACLEMGINPPHADSW